MSLPKAVFWIAGGVAAAAGVALAAGPVMSRVEQPDYEVEKKDGLIEIRHYGPMIAAEAVTKGERTSAINEGFRLIAGYIFGKNEPHAKIAMTAPVEQQKGEKIAMTAPVTQELQGDRWSIRFIMPKSWSMETLPVPSDERVTLKVLPARRFIVVTFSGVASDDVLKGKTEELVNYASNAKLATKGEPVLAFYNPPWTLPIFRRNEVMIELV